MGKDEVKNKGGEYVDLFSTFHSGLPRGGIFNGLSLGIVCTTHNFGEGKFILSGRFLHNQVCKSICFSKVSSFQFSEADEKCKGGAYSDSPTLLPVPACSFLLPRWTCARTCGSAMN